MAGPKTIRRGIGFGPLPTISRGLLPGLDGLSRGLAPGLATIRRGVGFGPLPTISRGILPGLDYFTPGIALAILASPSVAVVMAAGSAGLVEGTISTVNAIATPTASR